MIAKYLLALVCFVELSSLVASGGHKKVIIHVPIHVKHHHHKHTIVKHIHHKHDGGGGKDDHYEVLGYTYGEPKHAPQFGGGHGWHLAEGGEGHGDAPVSFEAGDHGGYALTGEGDQYGHGAGGY